MASNYLAYQCHDSWFFPMDGLGIAGVTNVLERCR